ncbi:MAG: ATP-binding cassette domain-containing protein [Desulfobacterales bacterium]|nr:ATP-binding cassette domain-containing protein [Desulfobacterales bacterium]MBF0395436.1 ATP-binding cassette domain-containing protein [Desulfobacterales bacterium]
MFFAISYPKRKFLVPQAIQMSDMDCGPKILQALLKGFGIPVNSELLLESFKKDTAIDFIDNIKRAVDEFGLESKKCILPIDHIFMHELQLLPAIVMTLLPNGFTHFVLIWRIHGSFVQVMDPRKGRYWITKKQLLQEICIHTSPILVNTWHDYAKSDEFIKSISMRMENIKINKPIIDRLINSAKNDTNWKKLAALDAAIRMLTTIVDTDGISPGDEAGEALETLFANQSKIMDHYWHVHPLTNQDKEDENQLLQTGALAIRIVGKKKEEPQEQKTDKEPYEKVLDESKTPLNNNQVNVDRELLKGLVEDGYSLALIFFWGLFLASFAIIIETILLRTLIDIGQYLGFVYQRITFLGIIFLLLGSIIALHMPLESIKLRIGRRIEIRLRVALLKKLPKIGDKTFYGRPMSDIGYKAYDLRKLKEYPEIVFNFLRGFFEIILTIICIVLISPNSMFIVLIAALVFIILPMITFYLFYNEQSIQLFLLDGAISQSYLDSLLGLVPIRAHRAEQSIRREHEGLMIDWAKAAVSFFKLAAVVQVVEKLIGNCLSIWLLFHFFSNNHDPKMLILLMYWTLKLPTIAIKINNSINQYSSPRSALSNLLEILNAPDENESEKDNEETSSDEETSNFPIELLIEDVTVQAGGYTILEEINLKIKSNEHIAIVGHSGAGKSSLIGLILGWLKPLKGRILVDDKPINSKRIIKLRNETAWVDPSIQIWNRTFLENLKYGSQMNQDINLKRVINLADLLSVLEKLPDGLHTVLGENGGLVSGGEGQRIRFGRAMLKEKVRLAILDEPFRGLDREKRRELLHRAREFWKNSTMIFISHDVGETLSFERVIVMENGKIIEDDCPSVLFEKEGSIYSSMIKADQAVRKDLWASADWKKLWLKDGKIQ